MMLSSRRKTLFGLTLALCLLALMLALRAYYLASPGTTANSSKSARRPIDPAPLAQWPWPNARIDSPHQGVTHWIDQSSPDGTVIELLDFDFRENPHLRLELFDQDEDDKAPFDNHADYWTRGVAQVTHQLNDTGRGTVIAAWNGVFFNPDRAAGSHVAPIVLAGKAYYNVGLMRWAVGVKYQNGGPIFKTIRLPDMKTLSSEYDYAAEGACCLINQGRPLRLHPFPKPEDNPFLPTTPPAADEAGFTRGLVDYVRTSRTSMAWSEDNRHFYLLIVKEPDSEHSSVQVLNAGQPSIGGWTVADLQKFWNSFGVWGAVNVDGGDATQLTALRSDGQYDLVPSRVASDKMRLICSPAFTGAPAGETMMFFYIKDQRGAIDQTR